MCGIFGVIGESHDPVASFEILTRLFEKTESRGEDASGFWGTQAGADGGVIYYKEPIKAREFIKTPMWQRVNKFNPNLLICHCRAASFGSGSPSVNKNNHPFVSNDKTVGVIHNGLIKESEYTMLKKKYKVASQCDSEMFLRVFEAEKDSLEGIRKIWSYMSRSHMALAIGERLERGDRSLWLLRNEHRSIWLADLNKLLGQVFFFSTPDIWDEAASCCKFADEYLRRVKQIEIPEEEVWKFDISVQKPTPFNEQLSKFTLDKAEYKAWVDDKHVSIAHNAPVVKIISQLDTNEEPIKSRSTAAQEKKKRFAKGIYDDKPHQDEILFPDSGNQEKTLRTLENLCQDIRTAIDNIETSATNLIEEGSMKNSDLADLFNALEQSSLDLIATDRIVDSTH